MLLAPRTYSSTQMFLKSSPETYMPTRPGVNAFPRSAIRKEQQQAAAQALLCPRLPLQALQLLTCVLPPVNHTSSGFLLARAPRHWKRTASCAVAADSASEMSRGSCHGVDQTDVSEQQALKVKRSSGNHALLGHARTARHKAQPLTCALETAICPQKTASMLFISILYQYLLQRLGLMTACN
jgi:hypothetical protein